MTKFPQTEIARDTPVLLEKMAAMAFYPPGSTTARTLRAEAARGKLAISRVGKKYYTTLAAIERMISLCHVPPKVPISTSGGAPDANQSGSSETEGMKSAQAALKASMEELKKGSQNTLPPNTGQTSATVIRPKFPSRTSSRSTPRKERQ